MKINKMNIEAVTKAIEKSNINCPGSDYEIKLKARERQLSSPPCLAPWGCTGNPGFASYCNQCTAYPL